MSPKNIIQNLYLPSKSDKSIYCRACVCLFFEKMMKNSHPHHNSNIDRCENFLSRLIQSIPITNIHKMVNLFYLRSKKIVRRKLREMKIEERGFYAPSEFIPHTPIPSSLHFYVR